MATMWLDKGKDKIKNKNTNIWGENLGGDVW